jgi:hypothetical protein
VERWRLIYASLLSVAFHLSLLLLGMIPISQPRALEPFGAGGAIPIEIVSAAPDSASTQAPLAEEIVEAPVPPAPVPAPPRPRVAAAPKPAPKAHVVKAMPEYIDGVRIATADDLRRRLERLRKPAPASAPPAAPEPPPAVTPHTAPAGALAVGEGTGPASGPAAGVPDGQPSPPVMANLDDDRPHVGRFRADTPGYDGRIFGQVSVRSSQSPDSYYGRIHMFRRSAVVRDYSPKSLFGYSFQQRYGEVAARGFETGRVTTPGAYLMVTDLFSDGHLSTMSHTVIFAFPRRPPGGGSLYDVVEESNGDFRLRGPAGSALIFDGKNGALRRQAGFSVAPPGESGSPPRVSYRGLHLRLEAVGSNPFQRDRPATVVDALGHECALSTNELFKFAGRRESDVFRFPNDGEFFAFLRSRCDGLVLPEPAPTLMAKAERAKREQPKAPANEGQGLLPLLMRGFR